MKNSAFRLACALTILLTATGASLAAAPKAQSLLGAGARLHADHSVFAEYPFGDDDISYGLVYEYQEQQALWQIAVTYSDDVTGTNTIDKVITPSINLLFRDRAWLGGLGALCSYVTDVDDESDWTDIYWQWTLGFKIPIARMNLELLAYYPFEDWSDLDEFDFDDVEFGAWLMFAF